MTKSEQLDVIRECCIKANPWKEWCIEDEYMREEVAEVELADVLMAIDKKGVHQNQFILYLQTDIFMELSPTVNI